MTDLRRRADERFEAALERTGARDPRDFYRERLKELREASSTSFTRATEYFEQKLIPTVADENSDPIGEWLEYGRYLANLLHEGQTVQIDPSGRSVPFRLPAEVDHLVLHLPSSSRVAALAVGLPPRLSPAQRATYDLLVARRTG
jgi:hypothetical protein